MADTHHAQGPGKSVLGIGQRIVSIMVEMVETRLRLAVVELEEEKANLFQLLLMLGLTMLFAAFGLMSLMVLIIWAVDPQYRLNAMIATTVVLLLLALIGGIWTLRKSRKSTLLRHTRHELATIGNCSRRSPVSSKVERERRKAQLLSQIQQQRLDLSASRREWLEATGAYDRRWNMLLSLRSWALVGSSVMAIWTIRHPNMLVRWARRGFGVWSAWRLVKTTLKQQQLRG